MSLRIFLAVSCLPSFFLMWYVYKKDKVDKEPFKLLALLFVLGAASCLPAALAENAFTSLFVSLTGIQSGLAYELYENFLNVAFFEELGKFLILLLVTRKSKHFTSLFDGLIYSVFVSLGFATLENILYVAQYGLSTGLLRAVTAIPGHMFDGVIMGQFYTLWHLSKNIHLTEQHYHRLGYIDRLVEPERKYVMYLPLAFIMPVLTHGMYDFLASVETAASFTIFILFLIGLYIYCFAKINRLSKSDAKEQSLIAAELGRKYPYLYARIQQAAMASQMQYNPFMQRNYSPYSPQNRAQPYQSNAQAYQNNAQYPYQ